MRTLRICKAWWSCSWSIFTEFVSLKLLTSQIWLISHQKNIPIVKTSTNTKICHHNGTHWWKRWLCVLFIPCKKESRNKNHHTRYNIQSFDHEQKKIKRIIIHTMIILIFIVFAIPINRYSIANYTKNTTLIAILLFSYDDPMQVFAACCLLSARLLLALTRSWLISWRNYGSIMILTMLGTTLMTICSVPWRIKASILLGWLVWLCTRLLITNHDTTFLLVCGALILLTATALLMTQSEKSVLLQPSIRRIIHATERPLRRLTSLIIISGVVFGGVNLSRDCQYLWDQWSLFPVAADIDTALTNPDYIVDGIPRPSTGSLDQTRRDRLLQRAENTWTTTKDTATTIVVTPQKMVFLSLCNAGLNLWTGLWNHQRFQGWLIIIGTLLVVSILDIPLLIIMGITRLILSLLDQSNLLPKHRRTIEVEQWWEKE